MRSWLPVLGLFAVATSLGSGHVCARLAFTNGANVLAGAAVRSVTATLLLLALLLARRAAFLPLPREFKATVLLGLFITSQTALVQLAVVLMPVTVAVLVFYLFPIFTGLASAALGDERFSVRLMATLCAAFFGLTLVLGVGAQPVKPLGVLAAVGAALSFACALVLTPRLAPSLAAPVRTFYTIGTSAVIFAAAAALTQNIALPINNLGWVGLAGLGSFYAAGITGLFLLLPLLGPTQTAIVLNLEPVVVAIIAWLALNEGLTPWQVLGAVIVVTAVILYQLTGRKV